MKPEKENLVSFDKAGKTIEVAMITNTDFYSDTQGGTGNYAKALSLALEKKGVKISRVGIMISPRERERNEIIVAERRISNYSYPFRLFSVAFSLRKKRDLILHFHRPDQMIPFLIITKKKRLFVCSIHGPTRRAVFKNKGIGVGSLYAFLEIIGLIMADTLLFVDKKSLKTYQDSFPWISEKAAILPPGVLDTFFERDMTKKEALDRFNFEENDRIICFIGRLEHEKNVNLIIQAFSKLTQEHNMLKLAIVGEGKQRKVLEHLARKLNLNHRIIFLGGLSHEKIRVLLFASEMIMLASKWEGSPLVVREALATGTRVVSFDVGDVSELIRDENMGYIAKEVSVEALSEGMEKIIKKEASEKPFLSAEEFSWDRIAARVIDIYRGMR